jgi:predicted amidophosphoribosyltransferase
MYKVTSLQPILDCFVGASPLTPTQIAAMVWKTKVIVHKYLKELVIQGKLKKVGLWSHVHYVATKHISTNALPAQPEIVLSYKDKKILQDTFYKFAENGKKLEWVQWFVTWCALKGLDPVAKTQQYTKLVHHIDSLKNSCGVINTTDIFRGHVTTMHLDKVYYADQYNWMEFGRWKLAEMTFFAKQSQNMALITQVIENVVLNIECLIKKKSIDAIAIVPPSVVRANQLLKVLRTKLAYLNLPFVKIVKYYPNGIPIPQKTLKTREQRKRNAQETILIDDKNVATYKHILLIDDFVWSGWTLNETAGKLKEEWAKNVIWFTFVGNMNLQYDVVNEI